MLRSAATKLKPYFVPRLCLAVREALPKVAAGAMQHLEFVGSRRDIALFRPNMLSVTVWMNMPSFYQDDLFCQLARKVDLRVVYDHAMTEDRRRLGWGEVRQEYHSSVLDGHRTVQHAVRIARSERQRIHIINGIWAETAFTAVAFLLGKLGVPFAIYSECPDITVSRSWLKRRAHASVGHWVARRARAVFAISHLA